MKKKVFFFHILALALLATAPLSSSCSRKSGCPAYESVHVKPDRRGNLPTKGGNQQLFSKNMRKKMKRGR